MGGILRKAGLAASVSRRKSRAARDFPICTHAPKTPKPPIAVAVAVACRGTADGRGAVGLESVGAGGCGVWIIALFWPKGRKAAS
ncbi:MAG: hypothetical protein ACPG7W_05920, partial [Paracoccaceae bacterium]